MFGRSTLCDGVQTIAAVRLIDALKSPVENHAAKRCAMILQSTQPLGFGLFGAAAGDIRARLFPGAEGLVEEGRRGMGHGGAHSPLLFPAFYI